MAAEHPLICAGIWRGQTPACRGRYPCSGGGRHGYARRLWFGPAIEKRALTGASGRCRSLYLSPADRRFDFKAMAQDLATCSGVTILCGRFEGVDERVMETLWHHRSVHFGDFVHDRRRVAAQARSDATVRLLPGVLGTRQRGRGEKPFLRPAGAPAPNTPAPCWKGPPHPPGSSCPAITAKSPKGRQAQSETADRTTTPELCGQNIPPRSEPSRKARP